MEGVEGIYMSTWKKWLIKAGILNEKDADKIKALQEKGGGSYGETLLKEKVLDRNSYLKILVTETPYPLATPGLLQSVPPGITKIISPSAVEHFICYPLSASGKRLQVAFLDPTDTVAINVISNASGMEIEPFCCHPDDLFDAIQRTYKLSLPIFDEHLGKITPNLSSPKPIIPTTENVESKSASTKPITLATLKTEKKKPSLISKLNPFRKDIKTNTVTTTPPLVTELQEDNLDPKNPLIKEAKDEITKKIERKITLVSPFHTQSVEPVEAEDVKKAVKRISPKKAISKLKEEKIVKETLEAAEETPIKFPETMNTPFFKHEKLEDKNKITRIEATPPPEPSTIFTPEATTDTFDALKKKMGSVKSKDEVAEEVLGWLRRQHILRGAILIIQKGVVVGWKGFGHNLEGASAARIKLRLEEPSIFKTASETKEMYHGKIPHGEVEESLVTFLQNRPSEIFLTPTILNNRVFGFILAEPAPGEKIDPTLKILPLSEALSQGFATLIGQKKSG